MYRISIILVLSLVHYSRGIEWKQGDGAVWAENCDFNENNLDRENIKGEDCGRRCIDTPGCTHFSYFDGWCYKKSGDVDQSKAFDKSGVFCGIVNTNINKGIEWKQGDGAVWAENCDFNENNLDKENIKGEDCGRRCLDTNDCTHFSYFDGWCYKKSGVVQKSNAFYKSGVYCGIVERNTNKEIVWQQGDKAVWAENCDFNENNLDKENIKGEDCGRRCLDTNDCTHFSYFDGWCYKKSGVVQKSNAFYKSGVYCGIVDRILNPVEKINYPLYHMTEIRVKVRNPQGGVSIEVDIDTIEYSGHHDYIKRITLNDGHVTTKRGWRNMFTNTDKHTVMVGSVVKVDMREHGLLGKWQRGKIMEKVSGLGFFKYEKEDLYIEFRIQERL